MQKGLKKSKHDGVRVEAIKRVAAEYNYTETYVRQCVAGHAKSVNADEIRKQYGATYAKIKTALQNI